MPVTRPSIGLACLLTLTIAGGLALDARAGPWAQHAVSVWVWGLLGWMAWRAGKRERWAMLLCLVIATAGEVVLALLWGLYDYRLGNLPLFVPPGHVLLFWLGLAASTRLPAAVLAPVPALATALVAAGVVLNNDWLSVPLLVAYLLCWRFGRSPALYSTMFLLALAMELWGTALGNWRWRDLVPGLDLPMSNPPLAAGAFYAVLDLMVLAALQGLGAVQGVTRVVPPLVRMRTRSPGRKLSAGDAA